MATLEERLQNSEYKLWVKASICLANVKEGLEKFAEERSKKLHDFVIDAVTKNKSSGSPEICQHASVTFKRGKWSVSCCFDCQIYVDKLIYYQYSTFKINKDNWKNSDITRWPNEPWEMVKVYMNKGQKQSHKSSKHTDLSGLVNFIDHCRVPRVDIQNNKNIEKVREVRNAIMHAASMKLSQSEFDTYTDTMIDLLEDPLFLQRIPEAQGAVKNIKEVQQASFHISKQAEFEVLKGKIVAIEIKDEILQQEVDKLKSQFQEEIASVDAKMKSIRESVEKESHLREDEINALKDEIGQKETQINELQTELILVKKLVSQDKDLFIKLDVRVQKVEITLDKTTEEFKTVKQSQINLINQVNRIQSELEAGKAVIWPVNNAAEIRNLEQRNAELQQRNAELEQELKELKIQLEDHDQLKKQNQELQKQIDVLNINIESRKQEIVEDANKHTMSEDNDKLRTQIEELKIELEQAMANNAVNQSDRLEALEYKNAELQNKIDRLKTEHNKDSLEKEIQNLKEINSSLEAELDKSSLSLVERGFTINTLEKQLQNQRKNFELTNKALHEEIIHIKSEAANKEKTCQDECNRIKEESQKFQKQSKDRIDTLERENNKIEEESQKFRKQSKDRIDTLERENNRIEEEKQEFWNQSKDRIDTLERENNRIEEESQNFRRQSKERIDTLERENDILCQSKIDLQKQTKDLSESRADAMRSWRKEEDKNKSLQNHIQQLTLELKDKETSNQEISEKNVNQEKEIEILNKMLSKEQEKIQMKKPETASEDIKVVVATRVDVRQLHALHGGALISGGTFLSGGELVLCDNKNKILMLLSRSLQAIGSLDLNAQPWDVFAVDSKTVVVTFPYSKKIKYVQILPSLQELRVIQLELMCWGIVVFGNDLYTTHCNKLGEGDVTILDKDGDLKSTLTIKGAVDPKYKFKNPENLAVDALGNIYVSDDDTHMVTCLDPNGSIINDYRDTDLRNPGGICIDKRGNIIVCGCGSNNLHILKADGRKQKNPLPLKSPMCLAYNHEDDYLVVCCRDGSLLVFELSRLFEENTRM